MSGAQAAEDKTLSAKQNLAKPKKHEVEESLGDIADLQNTLLQQDGAFTGEDIIVAQAESASGAGASSSSAASAGAAASASSAAAVVTGKVAAGAFGGASFGALAAIAAGAAVAISSSDDNNGGGDDARDTDAPTITSGATADATDENSGANQVVYTAAATDDGTVTYSLKAVGDHGAFSIDPSTGRVSLTADPDYETKPSYTFTVVATDQAGNDSEQAVTLSINDLDDTNADGNIMAGPIIDDLLITLYKADGSVLGSGTVNAEDGSYEIAIPGGYVGPVTAVVTTDGDADFDYRNEATNTDIMLTSPLTGVGYCDGGSITLYITPLTTIAAKAAGVDSEALLAGDPVNLTLTADQLAAVNTSVAQAFGLQPGFDITNPGGIEPLVNADGTANTSVDPYGQVLALLSSAEKLIGDGASMIDFFVNSLAINVSNPTPVDLPKEALFVMSMAATDSTIGNLLSSANVQASSFQEQIGLTADAVAQIDATAIASALSSLSFADASDLTARITAVTTSFASLTTTIAAVDMPLLFVSPARGTSLIDGETFSDIAYQANAFDPDDPSASMSYSIVAKDTDDSSLFNVDQTGSVRFLSSPTVDFETKSSYAFTIAATNGTETIERIVTIPVSNVDDAPPVFTSPDSGDDVVENSGASQVVYQAVADDSSDVSRGLTYSLAEVDGTDYRSMSIDAKTGEVTLLENPDYERKASYTFTVQANDGVNPVVTQSVTIGITDAEEVPEIVLFDLVAGEDYRLDNGSLVANSEAQTFDANKAYDIYVRMGTAWDTMQGDQVTAWKGASNLGADDHIFLIQDAGAERSLNSYSRFQSTTNRNSYIGWENWNSNDRGGSAYLYRSKGVFEGWVRDRMYDYSKSHSASIPEQAYLSSGWLSMYQPGVRLFTADSQTLATSVNLGQAYMIDANGFPIDLPEPEWAAGEQRPDAPAFGLADDVGTQGQPVSFVDGRSPDGTLNVFRVVSGATVEYRIKDAVTGQWSDTWTVVSEAIQTEQPGGALSEGGAVVQPALRQIVLPEGIYALGSIEVRQTVDGVTSAAYRNDKPIVVDQSSELTFDEATLSTSVNENVVLYTANPTGNEAARYSLKSGLPDDAALLRIDPITGVVTLASGDLPDYESGKTSYQFTVVVSDSFGFNAENNEQSVTVGINNVPNEVTVLFDLVNGEDYAGTDPTNALTLTATDGGSFSADTSYTIYISLPHIEDRFAAGGIGVWSGIENLGADDRIIFSCAADAAYAVQSYGHNQGSGNYWMSYGLAGNPSGWWWGSHWLTSSGVLKHSYSPNIGGHGTMVGVWYNESAQLMRGATGGDLGNLVSGVRLDGGPTFSFALANPTDADADANTVAENAAPGTTVGITAAAKKGPADTATYRLVNGDGSDYTGGEFQIDQDTGIVSVGSTPLDYEALPADNKTRDLWIKATSGTESTTEKFVLNVTDDLSDNKTVVLFDFTTGEDYYGSAMDALVATGMSATPEFEEGKQYEIYIRFNAQSEFSDLNISRWAGITNLGADDTVQIVQQNPDGTAVGSASALDQLKIFETSSYYAAWSHVANNSKIFLNSSGWVTYYYQGGSAYRDIFNGSGLHFRDATTGDPDGILAKPFVFPVTSEPVFKTSSEIDSGIGYQELVVLFDLTTGKDWVGTMSANAGVISNDMVEKSGAGSFDQYKTYDIYIRVGDLTETHSDEFIDAWRSAGTLGSDDKIYLVQTGTTATNDQYTQLTKFNNNSGGKLAWINSSLVGATTYFSASARLFNTGQFNLNVDWLGQMTDVQTMRWDSLASTNKTVTIQVRKDAGINQWFTLFATSSPAKLYATGETSYVPGSDPLSAAVFNHMVSGQIVPI